MMTKTKNLCCSDNQIIYEGSSYGLGPVLYTPALLPRPNLATEILQYKSKVSKNGTFLEKFAIYKCWTHPPKSAQLDNF